MILMLFDSDILLYVTEHVGIPVIEIQIYW